MDSMALIAIGISGVLRINSFFCLMLYISRFRRFSKKLGFALFRIQDQAIITHPIMLPFSIMIYNLFSASFLSEKI